MNNYNTIYEIDERRSIPMDLFPVYDKKLNDQWARETYRWCYLFDDECTTVLPRNDDDVIKWLVKAKKIREELQALGNEMGEKQVLFLAKKNFNLKMIGTESVAPTKVMDVVSIYGDQDYYHSFKDKNVQELYQMIYGLTRNGGNNWILNAEAEWMHGRSIKYKAEPNKNETRNRTRGCIYQNIATNFGNTNIKRFRNMMQRQHGEIMFVRDKSTRSNNFVKIQKVRCCAGFVYLGKCKNFLPPRNETENILDIKRKNWVK